MDWKREACTFYRFLRIVVVEVGVGVVQGLLTIVMLLLVSWLELMVAVPFPQTI